MAWTGNWISFVDTMLQAQVLTMPGNSLRLPTRFTAIRIDPRVHASRAFDLNEKEKGNNFCVQYECIYSSFFIIIYY